VTVDINDGTKAEEWPRLVAQLQATLNVIPAYTWYTAPSGGLIFVNRRTADYLGLPKDHPLRFGIDIGAQWDAHIPLLHPDDHEETRKVWSTCLRTGEAGEASFRVRNAQGGYRWFLSRAEPLRASDGTLLHWVGVNLDMDALRQTEHNLRKIVETVPGFVWSADPDGNFTQINRRVLDYSGMQFDDFLQLGWEKFLHPDDFPEAARAFFHSIQTGTSYQAVHRLRRADGEYRWYHGRGEPLRDEHGRIIQWYGLSIDIDEGRKAEEELRSSQARLARASQIATVAELSASIAHEINQPLAAIVSNAQTCQAWLSADSPNIARAKVAVDRIIRDATAAADVVRRIRALFKKAAPDKALLQTNEVIAEVARLLQSEMNRRGVVVELDLAEHLPPTAADRIQVQQVLMNLIRNGAEAAEASDSPGRLIVRSRHVEGRIKVEVCDSGAGIADKEKVFEPFYSTKQHGMGMGLAISRSIIQAHEGELWARDNAPRGTIFAFTLPIS
jgi:PAS domain S-box-containing protein